MRGESASSPRLAAPILRAPTQRSAGGARYTRVREVPMNASVLVVDDDPAIAQLLAEVLGDEGYDVRSAANGQQALDEIELDPVDVVISDVMMPQVNGLAL